MPTARRALAKSHTLAHVLQRPGFRQGATFVLVGGAATSTHVVTALLAQHLLAVSPTTANLMGYSTAVLVSYLGNAGLTFGRQLLHGPQFLRFIVVSLAGLALSQSLTLLCVNLLHLPFAIALIPIVTLVPICSFVLSKVYAFADPAERKRHAGERQV
jgi:putative flippase GtrA